MSAYPNGTITFLFTDVQGSTRRWEAEPAIMQAAVARHDGILRGCINDAGGVVFKTVGDAFHASFHTATDALGAALAAQRELQGAGENGAPLRVRMALHSGTAQFRDQDYFGPVLNRAARLLAAAHGGQILCSAVLHELVRDAMPEHAQLRDLGEHRLRDLERPEHVFQLEHPALTRDFPALRTLDSVPNNLPLQLTSFVGREDAMRDVMTLLKGTRLLTITGSGGAGKTRLALQAAADLLDRFPNGVWLVPLGEVSGEGMVLPAIASVLRIREEADIDLVESLREAIGERHVLVLLDNCEHLAEEAARSAEALLATCPHLRILATSRARLYVHGETVWSLPPLDMPVRWQDQDAERLLPYASVRLFIDRALAVRPDFAVDNETAPAVAQICHRLDGIPLAIELAAARTKVLSIPQILDRLDDRFRLLAGRGRGGLPHHQTLRAAIDWSYELLSTQERVVLRRLAVCRGGWTLDTAEALCASEVVPSWALLDELEALVDKSLVTVDEGRDEIRYGMLATIRAYAEEKLDKAGEAEHQRLRHLETFATLGRLAGGARGSGSRTEDHARLAKEHDNLRAALAEGRLQAQAAEPALKLGVDLTHFWRIRGQLSEGRDALTALLAAPGNAPLTELRALALDAVGELAFAQGDFQEAGARFEEALVVARALKAPAVVASAQRNLGKVADQLGDHERAEGFYRQSLEGWTTLGEAWHVAAVENNLGLLFLRTGQGEEAARHLEGALDAFRELDERWAIGITMSNLADAALASGDHELAERRFRESLEIARELEDREGQAYALTSLAGLAERANAWDEADAWLQEAWAHLTSAGDKMRIAEWLEARARFTSARGQPAQSATLLGAADDLRREIDAPLPPKDEPALVRLRAALRGALGHSNYEAALATGRDTGWVRITESLAGAADAARLDTKAVSPGPARARGGSGPR